MILYAPWYVRNNQLHSDLELPTLQEVIKEHAKFFDTMYKHAPSLIRDLQLDETMPLRHKNPRSIIFEWYQQDNARDSLREGRPSHHTNQQ